VSLVDVGAVDDFPAGSVRVVLADGKEVGVLRWRDAWYALRNICPHLGAPLCSGVSRALLTQERAASEDLVVDVDRPVIECPWHHWEFDVRSGASLVGSERVKTYPVHVDEGRVLVDLRAAEREAAPARA
jgi:nitrite reductase/ring-hydroxylating ferredoxin subunit